MATNENLPPNVIKQLAKELKNIDETPPEGIKVSINEDDFSIIYADIEGPAGTPYEKGMFRMKLLLSQDFPHSPPKECEIFHDVGLSCVHLLDSPEQSVVIRYDRGYFMTKIFHPNIAANGEICVNTLKRDWNPSLGLRHVLTVIRCLLIEPFPESALNEQAGKMLLENYEEYARHAGLYTGIHAKQKPKFKPGAICQSTISQNISHSNVHNVRQKGVETTATMPSPSLLITKVTALRGGNHQEQPSISGPVDTEATIPIVAPQAAVPVAASLAAPTAKREGGLLKDPINKKKMDARKKSLRRL